MPKVFNCSACGGQHKRPVGQKCQMSTLDTSAAASNVVEEQGGGEGVNQEIINAIILCKMEEGKVDWSMTEKIDRLRRAHAPKIVVNPSTSQGKKTGETQGVPCRYFQTGKCTHKADHVTAGQLYKHICNFCHGNGKQSNHPFKDCRNSKKGMNLQKTNEELVNNPYPKRTRVINASTVVNSSTNWRLDYYKFKGYSYAQVLKNVKSNATKNPTPALPRKGVHHKMQVKNKLRVTHKPLVVKAKKSSPQVKVGLAEYKIPCFNRFSPWQEKDKKWVDKPTNQQQDSLAETISCLPTSSTYQDKNSSTNNNESNHMVVGSSDTKYDLPLRIKNKVSTYRQVLPRCPTLQAWDSQNKFKVGFIPLGSLKVPD